MLDGPPRTGGRSIAAGGWVLCAFWPSSSHDTGLRWRRRTRKACAGPAAVLTTLLSFLLVDGLAVAAVIPPFPLRELTLNATHVTLMTTMMAQPGDGVQQSRGSTFTNQHMKLTTLLTLAIYMRVDEVVLPLAVSQLSSTVWQSEPASSLWDLDSITTLLHHHAIAYSFANESHLHPPAGAIVLPSYFCRAVEIEALADEICHQCRQVVSRFEAPPVNITLYATELALALRTDILPLHAEVALAVQLAPALVKLARRVVTSLHSQAVAFNGLHVRMREHDAGTQHDFSGHSDLFHQLNFSRSPLYVVGPIFARDGLVNRALYAPVDVWLSATVREGRFASAITNRRLMLPASAVLHSEQSGAVDFLVLLHARSIVGTKMSSFSFMLREYRALARIKRATTGIVGGPWSLFLHAASLAVEDDRPLTPAASPVAVISPAAAAALLGGPCDAFEEEDYDLEEEQLLPCPNKV